MTTENLSEEDQKFLAEIEEELKHRYTEKDEEFMKVFNFEPSIPPIMEKWHSHTDRRNNYRRHNTYERNHDRGYRGREYGNRDRGQGSNSYRRQGYNDYEDNHHSHYNRFRPY